MNANLTRFAPGFLIVLLSVGAGASDALPTARSVKRLFADPPREYATAPLWVWNDRLTEDQIRGTLRDLAGQKVRQVFVHPRPGLMTPYLSTEWFRLWKAALDEAQRLDMNVWIYDENSYPSGFAGGFVPDQMPESRGRGLVLREIKAPKDDPAVVGLWSLATDIPAPALRRVRGNDPRPEGRYLEAVVQRAGNSPWHGDRCYVDLMYPGVTERFLDITLGAYEREIGPHFGKRVPGVFTDEPNIRPAGGYPWTDDLPEVFRERWGYDLLDHLPSLQREVGDWRRVRHNYYQTLLHLFIERWAKPFYEACDRRGLDFTGHYWDHEWPHCLGVPDNMAMSAWQHRPGIDTLMNRYEEHTHAQFGNARAVREVSSLANQLGRKRTLVELYGAGGWDLRFEDMKRIADWLLVLGINTLDEHLSYITLRGARKRDHPQSFSYHEPWWEDYHVQATYLTRLCAALSQGQQVHRILVLEPTTTAWMYQEHARLAAVGDAFFQLVMSLESAQVEYDLGCEDVLARHAAVEPGSARPPTLRVGQRHYDVVVLPPLTENLDRATSTLLEQFLQAGGSVLLLGDAPQRIDGALDPRAAALANHAGCRRAPPGQAPQALAAWSDPQAFAIQRDAGDRGILFHHRRQCADGELLFLVNTSLDAPAAGIVHSNRRGIERWDPSTGATEPYRFLKAAAGVDARFELPPCGSLLLFLSDKAISPPKPPRFESVLSTSLAGPVTVKRLEPNVWPLDYVDITAGGETHTRQYFYAAQQFAFRKNGLERNPWDSAVQFQDELIRKTFPPDTGFTATYRFTIDGPVPADLEVVVERPDLYILTCNGQSVRPTPGAWWLDHAFGRIDLSRAARSGENQLTLAAKPFTIEHELEPAYLRGSFSLHPTDHGFVLRPDQPLRLESVRGPRTHGNNPDGTMWLSAGVGYGSSGVDDREPWIEFDLGRPTDLTGVRIWNYGEGHVRDLSSRGLRDIELLDLGATPPRSLGRFQLDRAAATAAQGQRLAVNAPGVQRLRIRALSNHAGVSFPASGAAPDNAFAGLAEVQFLKASDDAVPGVKASACSSELASHQRFARHVVDGSGLTESDSGWDQQGHPFYSHGVGYTQTFRLTDRRGRYAVQLGRWRGSVARVLVNGAPAGHIASAPWTCEITRQLRKGDNTIEVQVIGTLKNLLGPHHGNPGLGSAWPGMFHQGPNPGPPPGAAYHTVAYGLFEPFQIQQTRVD